MRSLCEWVYAWGEVRRLTGSQRCWWRGLASSVWSRRSWLQHGMHYQAFPDSKPHCRGAGEREKQQQFMGCTDSHHREGSTQRSEYVDRRQGFEDSMLTITAEYDRGRLEMAYVRHGAYQQNYPACMLTSPTGQGFRLAWRPGRHPLHVPRGA